MKLTYQLLALHRPALLPSQTAGMAPSIQIKNILVEMGVTIQLLDYCKKQSCLCWSLSSGSGVHIVHNQFAAFLAVIKVWET